MGHDNATVSGPDLAAGIPFDSLADGAMLAGHVGEQPVLLARRGDQVFAVDAMCTHYGAPLTNGVLVDTTLRCALHHACFELRTGEAVRAPALRPLTRYTVERRGGTLRVTGPAGADAPRGSPPRNPRSVVIVGAGAAADAAADVLRRAGYAGPITMIAADDDPPYDRPNLSKDYLAGSAPEEWLPLRAPDFHRDAGIELVLGTTVTAIDPAAKRVTLASGATHEYDALLLATGASPVRLPDAVSNGRVRTLRSLADCRALIADVQHGRRAVVVGASFIGLEVAAALRQRGLDVHVVAPESHPLERVMGRALSDHVRARHEKNGVTFHLGRTVARVDDGSVRLDDGSEVGADIVVAGIGVKPNDAIAAAAGLAVNGGIEVDAMLRTSVPDVWAAGDVARYPDPRTGERIRVEHWVVAQRMGQTAARNMLGHEEPFTAVPFFWSVHPDTTIAYVGHAGQFDAVEVDGSLGGGEATVRYRQGGRTLAVATVGRDRASLEAELAMERETPAMAGA